MAVWPGARTGYAAVGRQDDEFTCKYQSITVDGCVLAGKFMNDCRLGCQAGAARAAGLHGRSGMRARQQQLSNEIELTFDARHLVVDLHLSPFLFGHQEFKSLQL